MKQKKLSEDVKASESNSVEKPNPPKKVDKNAERKAKLKKEGFYDCVRFKLVKGRNNNIERFGDQVNVIKAMHETNIDTYNEQQLNTLLFIKKEGVEYELVDMFAKGRVLASGEPNPYKVFVEKRK